MESDEIYVDISKREGVYKRKKDFLDVKASTLLIVFVASTTLYLFFKNEKIGFMGAFKPIAEVSSSMLVIRFSMWLENVKLSKKLIYMERILMRYT